MGFTEYLEVNDNWKYIVINFLNCSLSNRIFSAVWEERIVTEFLMYAVIN